MRRATAAFILASAVAINSPPAAAQFRPGTPLIPSTVAECNTFIEAFKKYIDQLHEQYLFCSRTYNYTPVRTWVPGFRCSTQVKVPASCVSASNAWDCAIRDFAAEQKQCMAAAHAAEERAAKKRQDELDAELRKALGDTAEGDTKLGAHMTSRLAKWWANRYGSADLQALFKSLEISGYAKAAKDLREALSEGTLDPVQRAVKIDGILNRNGNLISREMTMLAVRGTAAAGRDAIAALDAELSRFGSEAAAAAKASDGESRRSEPEPEPEPEPTPKPPPEWICFPEYDQCISYCQQQTGSQSRSGWCGGICSDNGTGNRPKPSQFGDALCYHAPVTAQERAAVR